MNIYKQYKFSIIKILFSYTFFTTLLLIDCSFVQASENVKFISDITTSLSSPVDVAVVDSGDIYIVDEKNSNVCIYANNGDFKKFFGERGTETAQFKRPESIAVTTKGKVVVADTGNSRIQVFNRIGKFLFKFGKPGSAPGEFREPSGVVVDQFGLIYVADKGNKRIQIFSPNGMFLYYFDVEFRPLDLGIDLDRNLYILMPEKEGIIKYSPRGEKIQFISCVLDKKNFISRAAGIAVDEKGDIYITENAEHSIKKFDNNENILISFGSQGDGRGQFYFADGIACDKSGYIYIADSKNARVQIFKIIGNKKPKISPAQKIPLILDYYSSISVKKGIVDINSIPGRGFYALSDEEKYIYVEKGSKKEYFGLWGRNPGEFIMPKALDVTLSGKILVGDSGNNRVQFINSENTPEYQFGKTGRKTGQFSNPEGMAVNSRGEIYVADTNNNRLQIFTFDGIYLSTLSNIILREDKFETESFSLRMPKAIAINSKDEIYILDSPNNRVLLINEQGELLRIIDNNEEGLNKFVKIVDISVDENDNLYVADQGNYRIQIFDPDGKLIEAFGSPGEGGGYFNKISAICASAGKIYVSDYMSDNVQIFIFYHLKPSNNP